MADVANAAGGATPPPKVTVGQQWLMIAIAGAVFIGLEVIFQLTDPDTYNSGQLGGLGIVSGLVAMLAHGLWVTMDRRRLGLTVGWWRFGAFFLGPIAIWLHLLLAYRVRGLALIPLSIGVYAVIFGFVYLISTMLAGAGY